MEKNDRAAEVGKLITRAIKAAKPQVQRLATEAKPRLERAGTEAAKYAREHDDEIKRLAGRLVRARMGPLAMVVDVLTTASPSGTPATPESTCGSCGAPNPKLARFCNQCGKALTYGSP
jgi:hypothetical protein